MKETILILYTLLTVSLQSFSQNNIQLKLKPTLNKSVNYEMTTSIYTEISPLPEIDIITRFKLTPTIIDSTSIVFRIEYKAIQYKNKHLIYNSSMDYDNSNLAMAINTLINEETLLKLSPEGNLIDLVYPEIDNNFKIIPEMLEGFGLRFRKEGFILGEEIQQYSPNTETYINSTAKLTTNKNNDYCLELKATYIDEYENEIGELKSIYHLNKETILLSSFSTTATYGYQNRNLSIKINLKTLDQ